MNFRSLHAQDCYLRDEHILAARYGVCHSSVGTMAARGQITVSTYHRAT